MPNDLKSVGGLKHLPEFGRLKWKKSIAGPGSDRRVGQIEVLVSEEERMLTRRLGGGPDDAKTAQRVIELKSVYPTSSYPELVTFDYLSDQGVRFTFQAHLFGGRSVKGGLVPDFIVQRGGSLSVWQIQGVYWHSQLGDRIRDNAAKIRYLGQEFNGARITSVLNLWEDDIYQKRPQVFMWALSGLELVR